MNHLTRTAGDFEVEKQLWATQEREVLRIAAEFSEIVSEDRQEDFLRTYKAKGYPKTVIRGIAGAVRPETVERRLDAYRQKLGLALV